MNPEILTPLAAAAYAGRDSIATAAALLEPTRDDHRAAESIMRELTRGNPRTAYIAVIVLQTLAAIGEAAAEAGAGQ